MADEITVGSNGSLVRGNKDLVGVSGVKAAQNDFIIFGFPVGYFDFQSKTGIDEGATYAAAVVNDVGNIAAGDTTITYDGATAAQLPDSGTPFYIEIDGEIMLVTSYTSTVFTVVRGKFGTTAAAHNDNATIQVLNTIVLAGAVTGQVRGVVEPMYE